MTGFEHSLNSDENLVYFVPKQDLNISASFTKKSFFVSIESVDGEGNGFGTGTYEYAEIVDINATPSAHFTFSHWTGDQSDLSTLQISTEEANNQIQVPHDRNISLTPVFMPKAYTIMISSDFNGSIDLNASFLSEDLLSIDPNSSMSKEYNATTIITLNASATNPSFVTFDKWTLSKNGVELVPSYNPQLLISYLDGNYTISANFKNIPEGSVVLNISPDDLAGSAGIDDTYTGNTPTQKRFQASPVDSYSFLGWSHQSTSGGSPSPDWRNLVIDLNLSENNDSQLTAHFEKQSYLVQIDFNSSRGTIPNFINGEPVVYEVLNDVSISANPLQYFQFDGWEDYRRDNFSSRA